MTLAQAIAVEIEQLQQERRVKELSDDFAYTNGSIRRLDAQIADAKRRLSTLTSPTSSH